MRRLLPILLFAPLAAAQSSGSAGGASTTSTYTYDTNGRRVLASQSVAGPGGSEERVRNINGGSAPIEKTEERVVREDATSRVVERIIRPFDASGRPGAPQKIQIEERRNPDGSRSVETQVFEGNLNGGFSLANRTTAVTRTSGAVETTETQVARPTLNGSLEVVERREQRKEPAAGGAVREDTTIRRLDTSGTFTTAVREVKETREANGRKSENTTEYIAGANGTMVLNGQRVAETETRPDGSESRQVSIYGMSSPGRPAGGTPVLREQQLIEKKVSPGQTVETLQIRRPAVDNPNHLGPARTISEKVCTGKCQ